MLTVSNWDRQKPTDPENLIKLIRFSTLQNKGETEIRMADAFTNGHWLALWLMMG